MHDNEVFYQEAPSAPQSVQLTNDSSADLLNGVADWLYEEELLQSAQTLWWSLDGEYLVGRPCWTWLDWVHPFVFLTFQAFLTIDNRQVPHESINYFARRPLIV